MSARSRALMGSPSGPQAVPCPLCHGVTSPVLTVDDVPALANTFAATAEEARRAPRGSIDLVVCSCGMLFNEAFDEKKAPYSTDYENSLHFSPRFQMMAEELAERLASRYAAPGATVLEIGSGSGDFLALVAAGGFQRGVGLDPSLAVDTASTAGSASLLFLADTLEALPQDLAADLIVCRHVLEHVADPVGLLAAARDRAAGEGCALYVEVPDGTHMLGSPSIWDLIYEHVGYFTAPGLDVALAAAGWRVVEMGTSFGGQFLWAEAIAAGEVPPLGSPTSDRGRACRHGSCRDLRRGVPLHHHAVASLHRCPSICRTARGRLGAGSKGVMFVNTVATNAAAVVDVDPRKWGRFLPGTGHQVEPPDTLADRVDTILVMNPLYLDEVRGRADQMGVKADVLAVQG